MLRSFSVLVVLFVALLITSTAFAGAPSVLINSDFSALPANSAVLGSATVTSGYLQLTPAAGSQQGTWYWDPQQRLGTFHLKCDLFMGNGSATPADGMSFCYGPLDWGTTFGEGGYGNGLRVRMPTYTTNHLLVEYGATTVADVTLSSAILVNSRWTSFTIDVEADGTCYVTHDGNIYAWQQLPSWNPQSGWTVGIGGRTGGAWELNAIDNLSISKSEPFVTSIVRASANPVMFPSTSADYTLSFNEYIHGLDATDFAMSSSGSAAVSSLTMVSSGYAVNEAFASGAGAGTLSGTATVTSGALHLTEATNGQTGRWYLPSRQMPGFRAQFNLYIGDGNGADGFLFAYGPDAAGSSIDGPSTGLSVSFDTYDNGSEGTPNIVIKYAGVERNIVKRSLRTGSWVPVVISVTTEGLCSVTWAGVWCGMDIPLSGWNPQSNWHVALSAFTGGLNDAHWVDNFQLQDNSYVVRMNGLSGEGTLRLDLSGATIKDFRGTDIDPASYAGGETYTVDLVAPTVTSVNVNSAMTVDVTFSEAMGTFATATSRYTISGSGKGSLNSNPNSVVNVSGNTYRLTWTAGEMLNGGDVTITAANVADANGNLIGSPNSGTDTGGGVGVSPTVTCPGSASVNTNAGLCTGTIPNIIDALGASDVDDNTTSDANLLATLQQVPAAGTTGISDGQVITVTVTDGAGNKGQCTVTLDVNDNENPTVNCSGSTSVNADAGVCTGTIPNVISGLTAANVSDNCTNDAALLASLQQSPTAGTPGASDGQIITVTVTDEANNTAQCTVTLNVVDTQNPTVNCSGSTSVNTDAGVCTGTVPDVISGLTAANVADNCTNDTALLASLQQSPGAGTSGVSDGQVITVTVTDGASNTGQCTVTLDVVDNENPRVNCSGAVSINSDAGVCTGTVPNVISGLTAANVSDNCTNDTTLLASLQQSPAAGTPGISDGQVITVTVMDGASNAGQCTVTLDVADNENPTVNCSGSVSVNTDAGVCTGTVPNVISGLAAANVSDNCTDDTTLLASLQQSPAAGTAGVSDGQVITVTVTDEASHTGQCTVTLDVIDNEDPVVTPNAGAATAVAIDAVFGDPGATASDNCGVQGGTEIASGACVSGDCSFDTSIPENTWTIEYSAYDINGNGPITAETVFTVNSDVTPPVFSDLQATPPVALQGETVAITFTSGEPLAGDPDVFVNGEAAVYVSSSKASVGFEYSYVIPEDAPVGSATIEIMGMDASANIGSLTNTTALTIEAESQVPVAAWPLLLAFGVAGAALLRNKKK